MVELHFLNGIVTNKQQHHHHQQQRQQQEDHERESDGIRKNNDEGIELSLGLSLNGKFGVDPTMKENNHHFLLKRSCSSISANGCGGGGGDASVARVVGPTQPSTWSDGGLIRTCSLPVEAEEDSRKRMELQSLRRREAKRRRSEKQRSCSVSVTAELAVVAASDEEGVDERSIPQMVSQGSSGSSGVSEFESTALMTTTTPPLSHRTNKSSEAKSPQNVQSFSEQNEDRPLIANPEVKPSRTVSGTNGLSKNLLLADMPCVSTTGVGPNGKRINGFLYRYKKGEEVKIVCVCHGNFLTPAEFIKHAGGGDVEYPLRHIVVSSSPFL